MSIEQLKHAICAEQLKDSLVQWVQQRLATSIKNRNNLTESEMTIMNIDMNSEMIMTSEMQLRVTTIQSEMNMNSEMIMTSEMQLRVITIQSEMNMNSETVMTSEMQLRVITMQLRVTTMQLRVATLQSEVLKCWKNIDDVIYYDSKIYVLQISVLHNAVISQFYDDVFADHFRKSKTAELMHWFYNWSDTVQNV